VVNSGDAFYVNALRAYIGRFAFKGDPLDVGLRKLLMEVGLPRETQQIDRVVEAFAAQYVQYNPNLFLSEGNSFFQFVCLTVILKQMRQTTLTF
jgi:Sec7-like guanine-nucleotide exchange factor